MLNIAAALSLSVELSAYESRVKAVILGLNQPFALPIAYTSGHPSILARFFFVCLEQEEGMITARSAYLEQPSTTTAAQLVMAVLLNEDEESLFSSSRYTEDVSIS